MCIYPLPFTSLHPTREQDHLIVVYIYRSIRDHYETIKEASCPSSQSSLLILYKVVMRCKTTCKPIRKPIVITNLPCTPWKLLCNSLYVFCYNLLCCQANVCITPPSLHFSYHKLQQQQTPTFYTLYYGSKSLDDAIFIIKKRCFFTTSIWHAH